MKIVLLDAATLGSDIDLSAIQTLGNLISYDYTHRDLTTERIGDADIVLTNKVIIDATIVKACPNLKYIGVLATGTNNVSEVPAPIVVKNAVGYSSESVAQLTMAALLSLWHRLGEHDQFVKSGNYSQSESFTHLDMPFESLEGKQVGIIGMGNIGQQVATKCQSFGMHVAYHSASGTNTNQPYQHLDLHPLLKSSDVVSIHAPLNEHTTGLIGKAELESMKPTALLINMGRGGIVDEVALAAALQKKALRGAVLDVFANEPLKGNSPLLDPEIKDRLLLTPHIAWASKQAREKLVEITAANLKTFIG